MTKYLAEYISVGVYGITVATLLIGWCYKNLVRKEEYLANGLLYSSMLGDSVVDKFQSILVNSAKSKVESR